MPSSFQSNYKRAPIHHSKSAEANDKLNNDGHLTDEEYDNSIEEDASRDHSYQQERYKGPPKETSPPIEKPQTAGGFYQGICYFVAFVIVIYAITPKLRQPSIKECSYQQLRQRYQNQDQNLWQTLSVNAENILNKRSTKPAVYLFLHQGSKDMQSLVENIAVDTAKCFSGQLVEMSEDDFRTEDYGQAINKFKEKITKGNVALIVHLNKIPVEAARALHFICDTYTPIAEGVVIYLTLVTPPSFGKPKESAVHTLWNLWSSQFEDNVLDPLITRVTDEVIALE